ncbi:hypothetical protein CDAR_32611 [Caerostris darwini]|uniref:Ribosomal protein S2 n=1 Tax=Caerostris darwini TaxID=1538125 RepID=A0AAV4PCC4_9ARAC|nr:hypothetical protein CDAR_32611 [Caerostris darwini]
MQIAIVDLKTHSRSPTTLPWELHKGNRNFLNCIRPLRETGPGQNCLGGTLLGFFIGAFAEDALETNLDRCISVLNGTRLDDHRNRKNIFRQTVFLPETSLLGT